MKRSMILALAVATIAAVALAKPITRFVDLDMNSRTDSTNVLNRITGYLEEVHVFTTTSSITGLVTVTIQPQDSTMAAITVATNSVAGSAVWRPAIDATDVAGTALTNDAPRRHVLVNDAVRLVVSGSPTNCTWTLRIKLGE